MQSHLKTTVAAVYDRRIFENHVRKTFFALLAFFAVNSICNAQIQQAWVARYNNGIPNGTNQAVKMALDTNGNIYVTGFSQNTNGNLGYATIKYAPNGNQLWVARYDSTNYPVAQPTGLALDQQINTVVTGSAVTVKYDSNGNEVWTLPYSGTGIAVDSSNNVCLTGVASNYTTMKFTPDGTNLWTQTFTSAGPCGAQTINIGPSNDIYVCGYEFFVYMPLSHGVHATAIKYDAVGTQLWTANTGLGAHGYSKVQDSKVDGVGNLFFLLNYDPGTGTFLTYAYSSAGSFLWMASNPTQNNGSLADALVVDKWTNVVITGSDQHYPFPNGSYATYRIGLSGSYVWTNLYEQTAAGGSAGTAMAVDG